MNSPLGCAMILVLGLVGAGLRSPANSQTPGSASKAGNKAPTGTVSGRVTVNGKAKSGMVVSLRTVNSGPPETRGPKAITDAEGNYRISGVPAATYSVAPFAPTYAFSEARGFGPPGKTLIVGEGETVGGIDFSLTPGGVITGKVTHIRQTDLARNGVNLKFGESLSDVTITLAEGAASLRGSIALGPGESAPPGLHVHLVPAEKEEAENVLRFFANEVSRDGAFTLGNLPPGRYLVVTRIADAGESQSDSRIRSPGENELRAQLRRAAEAAKTSVELKPCQNVTDYSLALKSP